MLNLTVGATFATWPAAVAAAAAKGLAVPWAAADGEVWGADATGAMQFVGYYVPSVTPDASSSSGTGSIGSASSVLPNLSPLEWVALVAGAGLLAMLFDIPWVFLLALLVAGLFFYGGSQLSDWLSSLQPALGSAFGLVLLIAALFIVILIARH